MTVKEKSNIQQINTNLIYEIGGALDNLKVLSGVIDEKIEDLTNYVSSNKNTSLKVIEMSLNKIRQLGFILEDEHQRAENYLNELEKQINE